MKFNPVIVDLSKTYAVRRKPASDQGILYGAYHFLRPGDPVAQADHFLDVALSVAQPDELLLALDHEDRRVPLENAKKWLRRVSAKANRKAVLYSGFLIKEQLGKGKDSFLASHRLWLSHFSSRPVCPPNWDAPWIIQFTGDGKGPEPHQVPGIKIEGGIDLNHYGGTPGQLQAEWAFGAGGETG